MLNVSFDDLSSALYDDGFLLAQENGMFLISEPINGSVHELNTLDDVQLFFNAIEAAKRASLQVMVGNQINHKAFMFKISSILAQYLDREIALEPGDLANEIGILLGKVVTDKAALIQEFNHGFAHGVELSASK
jgi:hypothetical protein